MNSIDLKDRVTVITGGAQGIGYAIAERVIQSGGKVALWDSNGNRSADSASTLGPNAHAFQVDVTDFDLVGRAASATEEVFGRIDCLVNSAGITGKVKPTIEYDVLEWRSVVDVCLTGTFNCCRHGHNACGMRWRNTGWS